MYFSILTNNFPFLSASKTSLTSLMCASSVLLYIKISSKYTTTNFPMKSLNKWFINLINLLGTLVSLKGITIHLYKSNLVLKAIFHSSLFYPNLVITASQIYFWKIIATMHFIKQVICLGIRCWYLIVILLMALQYILHDPSFLVTRMTNITHGLKLSLTHHFSMSFSNCFSISLVSSELFL